MEMGSGKRGPANGTGSYDLGALTILSPDLRGPNCQRLAMFLFNSKTALAAPGLVRASTEVEFSHKPLPVSANAKLWA